jgi:GntR family transcriptional regulator / MocR family aminotransferase
MDFQLTLSGRGDLTRQIYRQMRGAILQGRLHSGERLPSTRELAAQLSVARKTVTRAYELLFSESLIGGSPGSGTYVTRHLAPAKNPVRQANSALYPRAVWSRPNPAASPAQIVSPRFDFGLGTPDVSLFPFPLWRSLLASSSRVLGPLDGGYTDPQGDSRLRDAIARYIAFTRGVVSSADRIVITHGAQQAFDLVARVLLNPGDMVAVEEPGYPPVRRLFHSLGLNVKPVSVDSEGICVSRLPSTVRLVYVTPSHQFPLGLPMSFERKLDLLKWAARHRACILEDDYDSEFRFEPRPLEALQSLDTHGLVVYVGTFSKVLHPGIRAGFIVAPDTLTPALSEARRLTDSHESLVLQSTLARLITEGHLGRHVRRMAKIYAGRRRALLDSLSRSNTLSEIIPSVAGLHVSCLFNNEAHLKTTMRAAVCRGVSITPLSLFATRPGPVGLAFGFGMIPENQISEAVRSIVS